MGTNQTNTTGSASGCPFHQTSKVGASLDEHRGQLNKIFKDVLHKAAEKPKKMIRNVIIYKGDTLTWQVYNEATKEYEIIRKAQPTNGNRYIELKEVAHYAVILTTILSDSNIDLSETKTLLREIEPLIIGAKKELKEFEPSNTKLIDSTLKLISQAQKATTIEELVSLKDIYSNEVKVPLSTNCKLAAQVQLETLHGLVKDWGLDNKQELEQSRVVMISSHGPKVGRVEAQYFDRLYQHVLGVDNPNDNML